MQIQRIRPVDHVFPSGRVLACNRTAAERLNKQVEEISGNCIDDHLEPGVASRCKDRVGEAVRPGKPLALEDEHAGQHLRPLMHNDEAQQKLVSESIAERDRSMRTLLENLPGVVYRCRNDRNWTMVFLSKGCEALTGYAPEDLIANRKLSYNDLIHPDDRQWVWDVWQGVIARKATFQGEYRIMTACGEDRWVWESGSPVFDEKGQLTALEGFVMDITQRRRAEQSLKDSEEKYRTLFESMAQGVFYQSSDGTLVDANPAALEIFGLDREELLGRTSYSLAWDVIREDGSPCPAEEHPSMVALRTGRPVNGAVLGLFNPKRKERMWLVINAIPQFHPGDTTPSRVFVTLHDITQSKRVEEQLRSNELFLRETQRIGKIGGWKVNPFTDYLEWTSGVYDIIEAPSDYSPEFTEGLNFYLPEYIPILREKVATCLNTGEPFALECRGQTTSGKPLWTEVRGIAPVLQGERSYVVGTFQDITERKRSEEALRTSEHRYRMVANYTHDWEYWIQPDGAMLYVSPSCERITGYGAEEFVRNPALVQSIAHPDDLEWVKTHMEGCNEPGPDVCQKDYRIITREGEERWISHYCRSIRTEDGTYLGRRSSNRDISERMKVREEKERIEAQLRRAQKLEAIGALAGGIAHDFNNILSPIIGYTELALDDIPESAPSRGDLGQVLTAAGRAKELIKQILSFSRLGEETALRPLGLDMIVNEVMKLLSASLPSSIEIKRNIRKATVLANAGQIHQLVVNLCTNAAQAMGSKGILRVSLDELSLSAQDIGAVALVGISPGRYARLTISDTGHGMDTDTLGRIFEPFFTTKEVGKGTGLGLAVVHGIVKKHGGEIRVKSEVGKGTLFDVFIPAVEEQKRPDMDLSQVIPTGTERILLVDDEPMLVHMGTRMLEQLGYRVTAKTSPQEALDLFRASPDGFDLIVTDYTMPRLSGADLAIESLSLRKDIPIILCTGFSESVTEEDARQLGIRGFAMKPLDRRKLAELVRGVLDEAKN